MTSVESIETERLRARRVSFTDLSDYCRMNADPDVMATLGGLRSAQETADGLQKLIDHWDQHHFGWYTLFDRSDGRFVGRGGIRHVSIGGADEVEIGYAFLKPYWGRGLATELAAESVRIAFEVLHFDELVAFTLPTNRASQRVMEKVGFQFERNVQHADLPHVLYRLHRTAVN